MSYFSRFSLVRHDGQLQINLTRRVAIDERFKTDPSVYYEYNIQETDTPENLADRFYDDPSYCWVILQFNDIINIYEQWPRSQYELESYINAKYDNPYAVHHYEAISTGQVVSVELHPAYDRVPVTNYEYEVALNEEKRPIKLVLPEIVPNIVLAHKEQIQRGI
jgi:hypothetical protein